MGRGNRSIEVVAERFEREDENYSFIRGHRVRLYKLYDAMHFKVPDDIEHQQRAARAGSASNPADRTKARQARPLDAGGRGDISFPLARLNLG